MLAPHPGSSEQHRQGQVGIGDETIEEVRSDTGFSNGGDRPLRLTSGTECRCYLPTAMTDESGLASSPCPKKFAKHKIMDERNEVQLGFSIDLDSLLALLRLVGVGSRGGLLSRTQR